MEHTNRGLIGNLEGKTASFAATFVCIFLLAFAFLSSVGATPDPIQPDTEDAARVTDVPVSAASTTPELPVRIVADAINLDVSISNPTSTDIEVLDDDLLSGAVRYPTSAMLGVDGTVLLFGHSSYLPIVHNKAYKTFDGIQDLKAGEIVSVYSGNVEYRYSVVQVKVADATQDVIDLPQTGKHLTLVTCDSFASKSNRFIVTADFVGTYAIGGTRQ